MACGGLESVNDLDGFIANFWRALQADPEQVAHYADYPVSEVDLHSRHLWLVNDGATIVSRLLQDPEFYDARVAGWWVWGLSCWIGGDWCTGKGPLKREDAGEGAPGVMLKHPNMDQHKGVHCKTPALGNGGRGVGRRTPHLASAGRGVYRTRPQLSGAQGVKRQLPAIGDSVRGIHSKRAQDLVGYMSALSQRLRRVRVCCGDWTRVLTSGPTTCNGLTAVFLDPPYAHSVGRNTDIYRVDNATLSECVREWAIAHGESPNLRIALCGYADEHEMPASWDCVTWKGHGGYGNRGAGRGRINAQRERIWFSPHCLPAIAHQTAFDLKESEPAIRVERIELTDAQRASLTSTAHFIGKEKLP